MIAGVRALGGGLAAVFAHPDDESFGCAGAFALAHDRGATTRLLVVTRGEAADSAIDLGDDELADVRERELICAAEKIGLDEVSVLDGFPDGSVADESFERLVDEIADWLAARRPAAVITFGAHGVTGHPDHMVVGSATRWAVERLDALGLAPQAVYVVSPVFAPSGRHYDLSPEEQAATHRIEVTGVAGRKLAALECHASQSDATDEVTALRAALDLEGVIYEGFHRVRPAVPSPHPKFDVALL